MIWIEESKCILIHFILYLIIGIVNKKFNIGNLNKFKIKQLFFSYFISIGMILFKAS